MRLLYIHSGFPNPSEPFISNEIEHLRAQGAEVLVLDLRPRWRRPGTPGVSYNTLNLIKLIRSTWNNLAVVAWSSGETHTSKLFKRFYFNYSRGYLLRRVKRIAPDRIVSHFLFDSTLCASKLANAAGVPHSVRIHSTYSTLSDESLSMLLKGASTLISSTKAAIDRYSDWTEKEIALIRQDIDLPHLPFIPERTNHQDWLAFGRLVPKKGFDRLLDALASLDASERNSINLKIYGDGPESEQLEKRIKDLQLSRVSLHPHIAYQAYLDKLRQAAVLLVPSVDAGDVDGIPTVLAEAMACGTVVVCTAVGGIDELANDQNAFIAEADTTEAIANALRRCVAQKTEWPVLREEARRSVEKIFQERLSTEDLTGSKNDQ